MVGSYDPGLVVLSVLVAVIASYTALDLAGRVSAKSGASSRFWLLGGAFSMGTGIWAMHFVGMLAFHLPVPLAYDVPINALSWLIATAVSGVALYVVRRPAMTAQNLSVGAALMGTGICAMHYTGMAAMRMTPPIVYDRALFIASVIIAIVASLAALWMAFQLRQKRPGTAIMAKIGSALLMGFAIAGMHYTAMAAAEFAPDSICLAADSVASLSNQTLAVLVSIGTLGILGVTLAISAFDSQLAARTVKQAESLQVANEQLRNIALYDNLTGLPNRLLLEDRMQRSILRGERSGKSGALMFVDLDRFKSVNDTFGHRIGDELLKTVAQRLTSCIRKEDTVARVGGDEFVVVINELSKREDAALIGGKMLQELSRPFSVERHELEISGSIGISVFPDDGKTLQELMNNADVAMYHAKKAGRNGYLFFALGMGAASPRPAE
ncbi:MAG TPA: diguanylate cyclase [Burkholderiales bacterium]|nr:diguanylate cyclase [Burkholderiales bacterium]